MEKYEELLQRVCVYVESKLKKCAILDVSYNIDKYEIYIEPNSNTIDDFIYKTDPYHLELCIRDNGCIIVLGDDIVRQLHNHIDATFFKYD